MKEITFSFFIKASMEEELQPTWNNLGDAVRWLKEGYCVCVHNWYCAAQVYCPAEVEVPKGVIMIDVHDMPSLLDTGNWDYYLLQYGTRRNAAFVNTYRQRPEARVAEFELGWGN